jgi:DNA-binding transcriptional MerR regulator
METQKDFEGKPIVKICASCQRINMPGMEKFGLEIDQKIKDEMKIVDNQVKSNSKNFSFSHGICQLHLIQQLKLIPGMTKERIKSMVDKSNQGNPVPCLLQDEFLRHNYMKGLFTSEQIQQASQELQQSNKNLKEHFRTLAGIKN